MKLKITILGAGNVGFHLAQRLYACGHDICQILSRNLSKAAQVSKLVEAEAIDSIDTIDLRATLYIIAIKDQYIQEFQQKISFLENAQKIVVHTSGAVSSQVFNPNFSRYGVFYPLQSFSRIEPTDFNELPFCIYGNTTETESVLVELAQSICPNVYLINDTERSLLHVAAVIVNNFSNYLYSIAHHICLDNQIPFDLLKALIAKTARNVQQHQPIHVQTGPAIRKDESTISKHVELLNKYPDYQAIYQLISQGIIEQTSKEDH